jgi:ribose transport system ATP-binding protein
MGRRKNVNPLLQTDALCKSFGGAPVLRDVTISVNPCEVLGIVGENGAGKSTLMNLLAGVLPADSGRMLLDGAEFMPQGPLDAARRGLAFVHQELNLFANLTIAENLFLTDFPVRRFAGLPWLDRQAARKRTRALLDGIGLRIDPGTPVECLSPGERQLVEIAKALQQDARVVIFDEPTTSLTTRDAERLSTIVRSLTARGAAVIYISHALAGVLRIADRILVMRDGQVAGAGPAAEFTEERLIGLMVGRAIGKLYPPRVGEPGVEPILEARRLSHPAVLRDVSLTVHRGEILGLAGLMGSGRSELARVLFGLDPCESGEVLLEGRPVQHLSPRLRVRRGMALMTESRRDDGLLMAASAAENLALVWPQLARPDDIAAEVQLHCASLDRQPVAELSGGNQQKVALGKWLAAVPKAMILDEPTRGIDVGARQEIYRILHRLAAAGVALLVISSEIEELTGICDRILVMRRGSIAAAFDRGNYHREAILEQAI